MPSPFKTTRNAGSSAFANRISAQLNHVHTALNHGLASNLRASITSQSVYSPESIDPSAMADLVSVLDEASGLIENNCFSFEDAKFDGNGDSINGEYQLDRRDFAKNAARIALAVAANPKAVAGRQLNVSLEAAAASRPGRFVVATPPGVNDALSSLPRDVSLGLEAYDEKNNKDAVAFSVVWNANFRQSPWAEAFYPLYLLTPDQLGITFTVPVVQIQPELRRDTSGDPHSFNRRNVMRALVDPSIIDDSATDVVPVVRPNSTQYFADPALIAPEQVMVAGESVKTAPLLVGQNIDLLSISQTEALLETGAADTSDAIDPSAKLSELFTLVNGKAVRFDVSGMSYGDFNYAPQDNYRKMLLNVSYSNLLISKNTKTCDGLNVPGLDAVYADDLELRVGVDVSATLDLESGIVRVGHTQLSVTGITNATGNRLAKDDPRYVAIAAIIEDFAKSKLYCFTVKTRRTNSNLRVRGQLLNTNYFTQLHGVPQRAPVSIPRPQNQGDQNDGADLAALLQTTYARATNSAHAEFFRHAAFLKEFVGNVKSHIGEIPEILGVARLCGVQPFYEQLELDISKVVQITSTEDKTRAVMEAICYTLRDQVYRGWVGSEFMVARDAMRGPGSANPTIIVGVPPYLRNYLQIFGDVRIFGENFDYRIVESTHPLHKDKIVWSFGYFDGNADGQPNPLHFGICAMRPDITAVLQIPRNGGYSKELLVVPSYLHISNLPVVGEIKVTGLQALANTSVAMPIKMIP